MARLEVNLLKVAPHHKLFRKFPFAVPILAIDDAFRVVFFVMLHQYSKSSLGLRLDVCFVFFAVSHPITADVTPPQTEDKNHILNNNDNLR